MRVRRIIQAAAATLLGIVVASHAAPAAQGREATVPQDYSECQVEGFVYFVDGSSELNIDHRLNADGTLRFTESREDALRLRYDYSGERSTLVVDDPRSDLVAIALAMPVGGDATLTEDEAATLVGAYELSATPGVIATSIGEVVATTEFYALEPVRWASLTWQNPGGALVTAEPLVDATGSVILTADAAAYEAAHGATRSSRSAMIWDEGPRCPATAIATYPIADEPVDAGDELWIGATITSTKGGQIDGVATLYACGPTVSARACASGGTSLGSSDAAGFPADDVSMRFVPAERGWYCFRTEFVGWGLDDAVSADTDSCLQVPSNAVVDPTPTPTPTSTTPGGPVPGDGGEPGSASGPEPGAPVPAGSTSPVPVVASLVLSGLLLAGIAALTVALIQRHRRPRIAAAPGDGEDIPT